MRGLLKQVMTGCLILDPEQQCVDSDGTNCKISSDHRWTRAYFNDYK